MVGCNGGDMSHDMGHADVHDASGAHSHEPIELGTTDSVPTVSLVVLKDPVGGWNAHVSTTNFRFAPEHASLNHISGEGHAHLYVDGQKIARLYSEWFHIASLSAGTHKITVSLNANDHAPFVVNGQPLEASVTVDAN